MTFSETIRQILLSASEPMTPQEIRELIKEQYPHFYGTESHLNNVQRGNYKNIDHALLAQIYSIVRTSESFFCDKKTKPMKISLVDDSEPSPNVEDYESNDGIVYVLRTETYTKDGKEIIKIGFTAQDIDKRINQLYSTGVPFKFKVQKTYRTKNFIELESAIHKLLDPFKLNKSREFFTEDALKYIDKIIDVHEQIQKESLTIACT